MGDSRQKRIRGFALPRAGFSALRTEQVQVEVKAEFRPGGTRAGIERQMEVVIGEDDLIELEYEDGLRLWLTAEEYDEKLRRGETREGDETGVLGVPDSLEVGGGAAATRGVMRWVLKSLKLIGVRIDVGKHAVREIARAFEEKKDDPDKGTARRIGLGLHRCNMVTGNFELEPLPPASGDNAKTYSIGGSPVLVFIHGTASSTFGSFGELWSPARGETLDGLHKLYGEHVYGFDHRSLTEGPIENALELARELEARVHNDTAIDLVSHSRGGLVGEILCRLTVPPGEAPFDKDDINLAGDAEWLKGATELDAAERKEAAKALLESARQLAELNRVLGRLRDRNVRIRRFVRVACPVLGTSLASRRLDRWAQIVLNVGSLAARTSPIAELVDTLGDFLAYLIKQKTRPEVLPGLAAMLPDASLLRSINSPVRFVATELAVIAGDLEAESIWRRLLTLIADKFYDGEHDLVVNTGSMYGGAPRSQASAALLAYQRGDAVNHFTYFRNERSATALLRALEIVNFADLEGSPVGFEYMRPPVKPIAREVSRGPSGPRPIVFVLPGIMGSELAVGGDRVWLNPAALFLGGLVRLRLGARNVTPKGVYAPFYEALIDYLADSHKVIPFPYDWRRSPDVEARRLADAVREAVRSTVSSGQPVRIVAHSMGGLVARSMVAQHPDVWQAMTQVEGARLVMLGTPNRGSYSINELIVGQSSTIRRLALADVRNRKQTLLDVITRFPGVLSLLPVMPSDPDDYLSDATWKRYAKSAGDGWTLPDAVDLKTIRDFRQQLDGSVVDPEKMVYVAGQAPETLIGMRYERGKIRFRATNRGDGQVPWDGGIPEELKAKQKAWFMPGVVHGSLPSAEEHFPALLDLLRDGTTTRLRQEEPVSREAAQEWEFERGADETLPDEAAIAAAALGGSPSKPRRRRTESSPLRVSVMHGHLKFADWPVVVGHYQGDTIISAERALDGELDGRLTQRHRLGLYPGELKTFEVVLRKRPAPSNRWRGAIVVGLGPVGELGVGGLVSTVTQGLLAYAVKLADRDFETMDAILPGEIREIGVSALMVGTNAGGVSERDSVLAVIESVLAANQELRDAKRPIRIAMLQFVELLQSKALQAIEDLRFLADHARFKGRIMSTARLETRRGARSQLIFKEPEGWWQRLQIKGGAAEGEPEDAELRFVALTRRARAESRLVATQRALVDQFVGKTIGKTQNDPEVCRTLFELLLPNEIKEQSPNRDKLVLVLDEEAARYPWEMLENRLDGDGTPVALSRGLLRQLELKQFREAPVRSLGRRILVIGDPELPEDGLFRPLPGARAEAQAVAELFRKDERYEVVQRIQDNSGNIIRALYASPYQIVHLAGHGAYQWKLRQPEENCEACGQPAPESKPKRTGKSHPVTGMVLGDDVFLTPGEVEQMRRVPELVFINCCHLGYVEGQDRAAEGAQVTRDDYNKFAANVATQFMRLGVRAVVAAGWAVDDAAAKTFALEFYRQMLDGTTFGDAVLAARQATNQRHPYANTWGAYQCYGDPDFFLIETPPARRGRPEMPASLEQLINRVDELRAEIDCAGDSELAGLLKRLDEWRSMLEEDVAWSRSGRAWAALARVYNAAFQFEGAISCYQRAFAQEDGGLTMQDMEQWTNCECRIAVAEWRTQAASSAGRSRRRRSAAKPPEFLSRISTAIARLDRLNPDVEALTNERLSVLGSAYKRLAWMKAGKRLEALREARDRYRRAATSKNGTNYALVNWGALDLVLRWQQGASFAPSDPPSELDQRLVSAQAALKARIEREPELWDLAAYADLTLLLRLRSGSTLGGPDAVREEKELVETYCEVRRLANAREDATVVEQLEFLADMAEQFKPDDGEVLTMLSRLRQCIVARSEGSPVPPIQTSIAAARQAPGDRSKRKQPPKKRSKSTGKPARKAAARKKARRE